MESEYTQMRVKKETIKRLKKLGTMGDSYDFVIRKLIDHLEGN